MPKAVIFDIDGTLLDSIDMHAEFWVRTFAQFGIESDFQKMRDYIGKGPIVSCLRSFRGTLPKLKRKNRGYRARLFKQDYLPRVQPFLRWGSYSSGWLQSRSRLLMHRNEITRHRKIAGISTL